MKDKEDFKNLFKLYLFFYFLTKKGKKSILILIIGKFCCFSHILSKVELSKFNTIHLSETNK